MSRSRIASYGLSAILLYLSLTTFANAADVVTRKSGRPAAGEVTAMTSEEVTVKVKSPKEELVKIPANDVISISWNGEPARLGLGRGAESGGKLKQAIETYEAVLKESKSDNANLKTEIEYMIARATAKQASTEPTERDNAIKKLEAFVGAHSTNWHYFESQKLLGELYTAKNEYPKAQVAYEKLEKAPWKETKLEAKVASGRLLTLMNQLDKAAAAFESVISEKPATPEETSQRLDAMLAKSAVLIKQSKHAEALKLLDESIKTLPAEDAHLQAEAALRQGDCLRALGKDQEAVFAYLRVDVLFSREKAAHAEALYQLTRLFSKLGQVARSDEARTKLESDFPNSDWTKQLKKPA